MNGPDLLSIIKNICINSNWQYGELWLPAADETFMKWFGCWSRWENYHKNFSKFSSLHKFGKGIGLIGRTWEQKKPLWIDDIFTDNNFLRTEVAVQSGLNSAVCIPVVSQDKSIMHTLFLYEKTD